MPARPNQTTQRTSGRSLPKNGSNPGFTGSKVTSTVSNIQFVAPSTKSSVPGVNRSDLKPKPPGAVKRNNNALAARPLPGAKLRPLQTNDSYVNDRYYNNTWSNTPQKSSSSVSTKIKAKPTPLKPDGKFSAGKSSPVKSVSTPAPITPDVSVQGRDSSHSIASVHKEVLPDIPKSESVQKVEEPEPADNQIRSETPVPTPSQVEPPVPERVPSALSKTQGGRPKTSKAEKLEEQADKVAEALDRVNIYKPEWYLNHKIRPATIKSGAVLLCIGNDTFQFVRRYFSGNSEDSAPISFGNDQPGINIEVLPLSVICSIEKPEDVLNRLVNSTSLLMVTMNKSWELSNGPEDSTEPFYPPFLPKEMAEKFNGEIQSEEYHEVDREDGLWRLKNTRIYSNNKVQEDSKVHVDGDENGYKSLHKLCTDLNLPFVNSFDDVKKLIERNHNKILNLFKQEQAIHPDVYLQPIEKEDCYNHLHMSYQMTDDAIPRPQLLEKLVDAVTSDFTKTSSPVVVTGGKKSGKTVLCSMLTTASIQQDANVITRYCASTTLSQTLADVLTSVSKQMHALYKTSLISPSYSGVDSNLVLEAFIKTLTEIKNSPLHTPLVIVIDGIDKVTDRFAACQFVLKCCGIIPPGISIVVSFRDDNAHGQFFHLDMPTFQSNDESREKTLQNMVTEVADGSDKDSMVSKAKDTSKSFTEVVGAFKAIKDEGLVIGNTEQIFTIMETYGKEIEELEKRDDKADCLDFNKLIKERRVQVFELLEDWNRAETRESIDKITHFKVMDEVTDPGQKATMLAKMKQEATKKVAELEVGINEKVQEFSLAQSEMRIMEQQINDRMDEAMEEIEEKEKEIAQRKQNILQCPEGSIKIFVPDFTNDEVRTLVKQLSTGLHSQTVYNAFEDLVVQLFQNPLLARLFCNWFNYDNRLDGKLERMDFLRSAKQKISELLAQYNELYEENKKENFDDCAESPFTQEASGHLFLVNTIIMKDKHGDNLNLSPEYFALRRGFAGSYSDHCILSLAFDDDQERDHWPIYSTWYKRMLLKGCSLDPLFMGAEQVDSDGTVSTFLKTLADMSKEPAMFRFVNTDSTIQEQLAADMRKFVETFKAASIDSYSPDQLQNLYDAVKTLFEDKYMVKSDIIQPLMLDRGMDEIDVSIFNLINHSVYFAFYVIKLIDTDYKAKFGETPKRAQREPQPLDYSSDEDYDMFGDEDADDDDDDDDEYGMLDGSDIDSPKPKPVKKKSAEKEVKREEKNEEKKEEKQKVKTDVKPIVLPVWLELLMLKHSSSVYILLKIFNIHPKTPCDPSRFLFSYDLITQILQAYGVDYLDHLTIKALKEWNIISKVGSNFHVDVGPLEMFHHFLTCNLEDLRATPNSFPRLFMSCFSRDFKLSNGSLKNLYARVEHEIMKTNQPHFITQVVSSCDDPLLSAATKHWMNRVSDRFAAAECISNAAYILSHNRLNEIKLWELTGDFIACHTLVGKIVAVCPLRQHQCFMAVTEEISDVGTRTAKVWYIDRQRSKCVLDLGQRYVHAAWFDPTGSELVIVEQEPNKPDCISVVLISPTTLSAYVNRHKILTFEQCKPSNFIAELSSLPHKIDEDVFNGLMSLLKADKKSQDFEDLEKFYKHQGDFKEEQKVYDLDIENIKKKENRFSYTNLESTWTDYLIRSEVMDELCMPMYQLRSNSFQVKEKLHKMQKIKLHGMTSNGEIVLDCHLSTGHHQIIFFKYTRADAGSEKPANIDKIRELEMNKSATMTLMPSDDFVYCDVAANTGLTSWHLPSDSKKMFGNEQNENVTCLQFEVEESQILSFTKGKVTSWSANTKTTESCFALEKQTEVIAACLQDNWLLYSNRKGEMTFRYDMRKKKATYQFKSPINWIDSHVIEGHVYAACHILSSTPSICFLRYKVPTNL